MAGVTLQGFVLKNLTQISDSLKTDFQDAFGASIDLTSTSNFSKFIGIISDRIAELWETAQALNAAMDVDEAEGVALDALCAITGTSRHQPKPSEVVETLTGDTGTFLPAGRRVTVETVGSEFFTVGDVTLVAATARASSTPYALGDKVTNAGNIYVCIEAGTSFTDASQAPTGTFTAADGTVSWRFMGEGAAFKDVIVRSVDAGPVVAIAFTLNGIGTPTAGWKGADNFADATLGRGLETDPALRIRRELELLGRARSTVESIRTRILEDVAAVTACIVFENSTESTDAAGLPPHSVECLVRGGLAQDIAEVVFANVAAGITFFGNQTNTVNDEANGDQNYTVKWSRPNEYPIWVDIHVNIDTDKYPADGNQEIKDAIVVFGATFATGQDVVARRIMAQAFKVLGVLDTPICKIGLAASPTSEATLPMALRDLATFAAVRITVTTTPTVP